MFPVEVPLTIKELPVEIIKDALFSRIIFPKEIFSEVLIVLFALIITSSPLLGTVLKLQFSAVLQFVSVISKKVLVPVTIWDPNLEKISEARETH